MTANKLTTQIRRISPFAKVIDINGEISSLSESTLTDSYAEAVQDHVQTIIYNFTGMTYMNSFGIGMLVMLLIRARREGKRIVGYGLNDHYRGVFELTQLDKAIPLYSTEAVALASAEPFDLPEREN